MAIATAAAAAPITIIMAAIYSQPWWTIGIPGLSIVTTMIATGAAGTISRATMFGDHTGAGIVAGKTIGRSRRMAGFAVPPFFVCLSMDARLHHHRSRSPADSTQTKTAAPSRRLSRY